MEVLRPFGCLQKGADHIQDVASSGGFNDFGCLDRVISYSRWWHPTDVSRLLNIYTRETIRPRWCHPLKVSRVLDV